MMSNTRDSIVVEPLQVDKEGKPIPPTTAQPAAGGQPAQPAQQPANQPAAVVDERYQGKTLEEIIQMHQNAESKIREQGQELGTWRKLVTDMSEQQLQSAAAPQQPTNVQEAPLELTSDELLTNPVDSISRVVERGLKDALAPIEQRLAQSAAVTERQQLQQDYPQMNELSNDEAFVQWATATPGRASDAQLSAQGDVAAARRLLEQWEDRKQLVLALQQTPSADGGAGQPQQAGQPAPAQPAQPSAPQGMAGAERSTVERGGTAAAAGKPTLTGQEIVDTIINDPDKYKSPQYQEQIAQAAKEGRLDMRISGDYAR